MVASALDGSRLDQIHHASPFTSTAYITPKPQVRHEEPVPVSFAKGAAHHLTILILRYDCEAPEPFLRNVLFVVGDEAVDDRSTQSLVGILDHRETHAALHCQSLPHVPPRRRAYARTGDDRVERVTRRRLLVPRPSPTWPTPRTASYGVRRSRMRIVRVRARSGNGRTDSWSAAEAGLAPVPIIVALGEIAVGKEREIRVHQGEALLLRKNESVWYRATETWTQVVELRLPEEFDESAGWFVGDGSPEVAPEPIDLSIYDL